MSGIHDAILNHVRSALEKSLITDQLISDPARAGVVVLGPLQGYPMDPDDARISVTLYENDPDNTDSSDWDDQPADEDYGGIEIGGALTMKRRFTAKARCLFERTGEDLTHTRQVASTVRDRLEKTLRTLSFGTVKTSDEYVSRGVLSQDIHGKMHQAGGPPDAYDYSITIRFEVLTTTGV